MLERAMVFQRRRDYRRAVAQVGWVWGRCGGGVRRGGETNGVGPVTADRAAESRGQGVVGLLARFGAGGGALQRAVGFIGGGALRGGRPRGGGAACRAAGCEVEMIAFDPVMLLSVGNRQVCCAAASLLIHPPSYFPACLTLAAAINGSCAKRLPWTPATTRCGTCWGCVQLPWATSATAWRRIRRRLRSSRTSRRATSTWRRWVAVEV
eukprot:359071-Chlamydomonas_euryale.AAC.1